MSNPGFSLRDRPKRETAACVGVGDLRLSTTREIRNGEWNLNRSFDLRLSADQEELADLLPEIDTYRFEIDRDEFLSAIRALDEFLESPGWLVYEWGAFSISTGKHSSLVASLKQIIEIGKRLRRLSRFMGFPEFVQGFKNPSQFEAAAFEAEAADFVATLATVREIVFSPQYLVRGRRKKPDFDVTGDFGLVTAECKRPQFHLQLASRRARRFVDAIRGEVDRRLPAGWRLEIEITGPVRGSDEALAEKLVDAALRVTTASGGEVAEGPARGFVEPMESDFVLPSGAFGTHVAVLPANEATGLFNPAITRLAVTHANLDRQRQRPIRDRASEALTRLPVEHDGLIFLGHVPLALARPVCEERLADAAYQHVRAFCILGDGECSFLTRPGERDWALSFTGAAW